MLIGERTVELSLENAGKLVPRFLFLGLQTASCPFRNRASHEIEFRSETQTRPAKAGDA